MRHSIKIFHSLLFLYLILGWLNGCSQTQQKLEEEIASTGLIEQSQIYLNQGLQHWQVGQWARYRVSSSFHEEIFRLIDSGPVQQLYKVAITGTSESSYWLELHIISSKGEQHIAALVSGINQAESDSIKITRLLVNESNDTIVSISQTELNSDDAQFAKQSMQFLINLLLQSKRSGRFRDITVPAGQFVNAKEVPFSISTLLGQEKGNALYSQAVPVLGFVKVQYLQVTSGWFKDTWVWELIDFGNTGSSSYFKSITSHS